MARNARTRGAAPTRRQSFWLTSNLGNQTVVASIVKLLGSLNAAALALRPFTIVRTHLDILVNSDQAAVTEAFFGSFAMGVVNETASTLGITGLPDPNIDTEFDWFVH